MKQSVFLSVESLCLKGNVFVFSVDYSAIDKSDILNMNKYLKDKNNIKQCLENNFKIIIERKFWISNQHS